jgi:hypothetical protein
VLRVGLKKAAAFFRCERRTPPFSHTLIPGEVKRKVGAWGGPLRGPLREPVVQTFVPR